MPTLIVQSVRSVSGLGRRDFHDPPHLSQEYVHRNALEIRFQAMLRYAWDKRSWHVIVADPGSGKTVGIREMIKTAGVRDVVAFHQNQSPKNSIHDVAHAVQELLDGRVEMQSRTLKRTKVLGMRR